MTLRTNFEKNKINSPSMDIRKKTLDFALDLVSPRNIDEIILVLKKEINKTQSQEEDKVNFYLFFFKSTESFIFQLLRLQNIDNCSYKPSILVQLNFLMLLVMSYMFSWTSLEIATLLLQLT